MDSEDAVEVCEGGFIVDVRRVEHYDKYVSFNLIEDYQGRVENIEGYFNNILHRLYIPLQWMNENISKED